METSYFFYTDALYFNFLTWTVCVFVYIWWVFLKRIQLLTFLAQITEQNHAGLQKTCTTCQRFTAYRTLEPITLQDTWTNKLTGHLNQSPYRTLEPNSLQDTWTNKLTGHLNQIAYRTLEPISLQDIWTNQLTEHLNQIAYRTLEPIAISLQDTWTNQLTGHLNQSAYRTLEPNSLQDTWTK